MVTEDWRKVGTRVITVNRGGAATLPETKVSYISRVSTKTFRVDGQEHLYSMTSNETKRIGGTWGHVRVCLPLDSEDGRREYAAMKKRRIIRRVDRGAEAFRTTHSRAELLELREAVNMALEVVTE